ncbi:U-scoloptoxin(20)-Cw1a [Manduca sexta]|uniref:Uncharacterized protein n=1 Tax=Manduca sexta TaxID=7130 RepID=A0A922CVL7_MANSE|nr:U-scoloptoxin(20)-Cw1a [Manduca sexta]KAG6461194.1 hypothetical protein O3G_MSEX012474 [Manduca sexta]KAG6461195.1 hypothetical protein O3G_MSEX012474 [Manduca sexta]
MFKFTFILSVMIIGALVWADDADDRKDCDACGKVCEPLCGTKQFRICCHNNLGTKREAPAYMAPAAPADTPLAKDA